MAEEYLIRLEDVAVSFGGQKKERKTVLDGISLKIGRGEIVGLAGESGSGKSTIAKAILGLVPTERGQIKRRTEAPQVVFQDPYSSLNPAKTIGWLLEEPLRMAVRAGRQVGERTAEELRQLGRRERAAYYRERAAEMLRQVGLGEEYLERRPDELSGGQRQRVCIGAALMTAPELLIADEPVSALDVTVQAQVLALMERLHQELGLAILFISHDLRTMYHFCDRILILHSGRIIEEGEPGELYRSPREDYTKLLLKSAGIAP